MNSYTLNVLIADDDNDDAAMLTEALLEVLPSCNCVHVLDGNAAIKHIQTNPLPDLVFLDLNMPLKNGMSCLKEIYSSNALPTTPVVVYSTSKNSKDIDDAYEHRATFYIIKPTSFKELKKIIKRALSILGKPKIERQEKTNFVLEEGKVV